MLSSRRLTLLVLLVLAAPAAPAIVAAAPRVAPLASAERDDAQRALTTRFAALGMRNAVATYARYPALASAMLPYTEFLLTKSTLPPRHRELLWLRTAWLARSDYLWAQRAPAARRARRDATAELARIALGPDAPGWEPFEAALLRAADELHVDAFVSDATWARCRALRRESARRTSSTASARSRCTRGTRARSGSRSSRSSRTGCRPASPTRPRRSKRTRA